MTLLREPRDRSEKYPPLRRVPWVRPVAVYRPGRRVSPVRPRGIWTLRPDSISEAARAFFWSHPKTEALAIAIILASAGFFLAWCLWGRP